MELVLGLVSGAVCGWLVGPATNWLGLSDTTKSVNVLVWVLGGLACFIVMGIAESA